MEDADISRFSQSGDTTMVGYAEDPGYASPSFDSDSKFSPPQSGHYVGYTAPSPGDGPQSALPPPPTPPANSTAPVYAPPSVTAATPTKEDTPEYATVNKVASGCEAKEAEDDKIEVLDSGEDALIQNKGSADKEAVAEADMTDGTPTALLNGDAKRDAARARNSEILTQFQEDNPNDCATNCLYCTVSCCDSCTIM